MYEILVRDAGDMEYHTVDYCMEAELSDFLAKWRSRGYENVIAEHI